MMYDQQQTETYMALLEAIQNHIRALDGDDYFARDWVLACGVEELQGGNAGTGMIRIERSPRSTAYTVTGLLGWALECYSAES